MSASTQDTTSDRVVPSIPSQVLRAMLGTFAVVLVLALVGGVVASWDRVSVQWYRVAGDPNIVLADGVTLSDQASHVAVPQTVRRSWTPSQDHARIAAVTGSPVRNLTSAQAAILTGITFPPGTGTDLRQYSTPLGVVVVSDPFWRSATDATIPGQISLYGTAGSPRQTTAAAQKAFLQRLVDGWGAGATPAVPGTYAVVEDAPLPDQYHGYYGVRVATAGASTPYGSAGMAFWSSTPGRLSVAHVLLVGVRATPAVRVVSPASAFDQLRHHADSATGDGQTVAAARLEVGDSFGINGDQCAMWAFLDAAGHPGGSVQALG
jgi:hypothetical protein